MSKVTLTFPDYQSLWLFKEKIETVNISIEPKKKNIHGPFKPNEIEMVLVEFKAKNNTTVAPAENPVQNQITPTPVVPRFSFLSVVLNMFQPVKI